MAPGQSSKEQLVASCPAEHYLTSPKIPADTTTITTALHHTNSTGSCTENSTHCVIATCPAYGYAGAPPDKNSVFQSEGEALLDQDPTYDLPMEINMSMGAKVEQDDYDYEVMKSASINSS